MDHNVADALALVDYNFTSVFKVWEGKDAIKDETIIPWCQENDHVWVHADDSAKKEHAKLIIASQIRTLWVYRKDGKMTGAQQLRAISHRIDDAGANYLRRNGPRHQKLTVHGEPPHTKIQLTPYGFA